MLNVCDQKNEPKLDKKGVFLKKIKGEKKFGQVKKAKNQKKPRIVFARLFRKREIKDVG